MTTISTTRKNWVIAGMMSGTSLDGLDIAVCRFKKTKQGWSYEILEAITIGYPESMKKKFTAVMKGSAEELATLDASFGAYSGAQVKKLMDQHKRRIDLIASHGHTIFHQPGKGFTTQIGNGAYIAAAAGIAVVSDFRTMDVGLGGQGAPLVPIGDKLLFEKFEYCLNLGGIANISFDKAGKRLAGDICPVNMVLNLLAGEKGKSYDKDGKIASKGKVEASLFRKLNQPPFYKHKFPKSLGREWVEKEIFPLLRKSSISTEDKAATVCAHIAYQIASVLDKSKPASLLVTGGGALNKFLIERIQVACGPQIKVVVPDPLIVSYKEALIFAFLGLKRVLGETNALSSVTGATKNSVGGALYGVVK